MIERDGMVFPAVQSSGAANRSRGMEPPPGNKSKAPVFVLGCPRSGTTVLYHMLLSAGDFAVYRAESNVFNLLVPRFRRMRSVADRKELLNTWLRSKQFRVSGLDADEISGKIMAECRGGGDFLRIVMQEIARGQGVNRWAECTPDHLLSMLEIKREIPDALFIHIIRDGRDVALSYIQQGWSHPMPWDRNQRLGVAALYWEWIVRHGREQGKQLGQDYQEVRFEELNAEPRQTLARLGKFIGHDLDYDRIKQAGIGSVSQPNSSFDQDSREKFNPVARWKNQMSPRQISDVEELIGDLLLELGYALASESGLRNRFRRARLRATYLPMFAAKQLLKASPLGRFVKLGNLEVEPNP